MITIDKEKTLKTLHAIDDAIWEHKCSMIVNCPKCAYEKLCNFTNGMISALGET